MDIMRQFKQEELLPKPRTSQSPGDTVLDSKGTDLTSAISPWRLALVSPIWANGHEARAKSLLMIVAMQESATEEQIQQVVEHLIEVGFSVHRSTGARQTVVAAVGARVDFDIRNLEVLSGVEHVHRISAPYKLAGRSFRPAGTIVEFANGLKIGGEQIVVIAGPCSVESREQLFATAERVAKAGARALRGGAFKPRSSPYSFQGLGLEALKLLREAGDRFGLVVISEVMEISQIAIMLPFVDIFQVGARNMQNF